MPRRKVADRTTRKAAARTGARAGGSARGGGKAGRASQGTARRAAARPRRLEIDETPRQRKGRAGRILAALRRAYPQATCALHHRSAYELLVATILSAQCTDERVNQVTPALFARYPDARALAGARQEELEELIRSTGFFRNKARNLIGMARAVCERHGGEIPAAMEELTALPGVARKTANCVLGTWFGVNEGIVVDTHVGRLAQRLGLLSTARDDKDAVRIERDLTELFPRESWTCLAHALIRHGREVCTARKPRCEQCVLARWCPSAGAFE